MNLTPLSNERRAFRPRAAAAGLMASVALGVLLGASANADTMFRQPPATPAYTGGADSRPRITSITQDGTNVTLTWYGPQGTYFIQAAPLATPSAYTQIGKTVSSDFVGSYTVLGGATNSQLFRVVNFNGFVGTGGCQGCHGDKFEAYQTTAHSSAYDTIAAFGNASCFPCHTVGNGQISGFIDPVSTPWLKHVGCESCHGSGGAHKYGDHDMVHPAVSIDPKICGSCHTDVHHPTYDEWAESGHAHPTGELEAEFLDPIGGPARQASCGVCHSGATRMAMLKDWEARQQGNVGPLALPSGEDASAWGPTCANCHDPHRDQFEAQLRNPLSSTNYFTMPTTTDARKFVSFDGNGNMVTNTVYYNTAFATFYDTNVQVCAQCHNSRGARWDGRSYGLVTNASGVTVALTTNVSLSRPPHHSPQYNNLIGILQPDYFNTNSSGVATNFSHPHWSRNSDGCARCHMYPETPETINEANPAYTGHRFEVSFGGCTVSGCHSTVPLFEEEQVAVNNSLTRIVSLLNQWATAKGPTLFGANYTKYKENAWEFTIPGALATITNAGPSSSDQLKIPAEIKQARFNAYMVLHDGSYGVHNPNYATALLNDAESKALAQFPLANFKASTTATFTTTNITFTSLGTGISSYAWDFGDGTAISTDPNPVHAYATPGVYSVKLTATPASGPAETVTRANYISIAIKPTVSFTATPSSGPSPLAVNFENKSTDTGSVTLWRWRISGPGLSQQTIYSLNTSFTFTNTFTTNVSYNVSLRGYTPGGNITTTVNNAVTVTP